jgi:hypothetical protein
MASERRHGIPRGRRAGAQVLAALTPAISVGAAVATGYATKNAVIAFVVAVVLFPLLSGGAFARRRVGAGLLATLAFLAAFAVEIFAGGLLLLRTPALYAVVAIAVAAVIGWLEIRGLRRMDGHAS